MLVNALTYISIDAAVVLYAAAISVRLYWRNGCQDGLARLAWSAGCILYITHVVCAFTAFYCWSHSVAYRETARQASEFFPGTGGGGLYLNYLFTAVWLIDASAWWRGLAAYRGLPRRVQWPTQTFLAFMIFNGAAVFAKGPFRFAAWGLTAMVFAATLAGRARRTAP